ncbi:SH3 domain-containing protein [Filimonas lacunae]|uniref:SH3 domain-containing protein n=1 Tax=Filimonas lacunae TaxID=477680 RepID=A0A173MCN6_9BACT|nr:hypothetical protein FLA_1339 [Filimonas lacunae]SIT21931.1 SH3 domain-containing protein [Filimonas lacunae]
MLLSFFTTTALCAQELEEVVWPATMYQFPEGDSVTVFADTAYVRSFPSTTASKMGVVPGGTKVVFVKEESVQKISGFAAPWVKVRYLNNSVSQEGYIWKGLLALGSAKRSGKQFLYGVDHVIPNADKDMGPACYMKVKVLDSVNKLLGATSWELKSSSEASYTEFKSLGGMGLEGVTDIVRMMFSGEACGIPTDYVYFGWTGTGFLPLPGKMVESDAGAFYHGEELFFPSEKGGQPGKIIKVIEDEEVLEEIDKKTGEPKTKKTKSKEVYSWDGKTAVKL